MLPIFTILHPIIDACSIGVLVVGGRSWERVVAYNAIAFALQLPLGMLLDVLWKRSGRTFRLNRMFFYVGTALVFAAALAAVFGFAGWGVLAAVCVGNALFHLTAGKYILDTRNGRSGPIGLFISTGALGLMAGQVWAEKAAAPCLVTFAAALAVCVVPAVVLEWNGDVPPRPGRRGARPALVPALVLALLFAIIAWRSWAALFAGDRTADECVAMVLAGAAATFAGKVAGGYLAERLGRWKVTAFSVAGSGALVFLCEPSWAAMWLVLLFVAQLATGPVLSLMYDGADGNGGTAFGLNCLGLFVGFGGSFV